MKIAEINSIRWTNANSTWTFIFHVLRVWIILDTHLKRIKNSPLPFLPLPPRNRKNRRSSHLNKPRRSETRLSIRFHVLCPFTHRGGIEGCRDERSLRSIRRHWCDPNVVKNRIARFVSVSSKFSRVKFGRGNVWIEIYSDATICYIFPLSFPTFAYYSVRITAVNEWFRTRKISLRYTDDNQWIDNFNFALCYLDGRNYIYILYSFF